MDSNRALDRIRELCAVVLDDDVRFLKRKSAAEELAQRVRDLDEYLAGSGLLPNRWRAARDASKPRASECQPEIYRKEGLLDRSAAFTALLDLSPEGFGKTDMRKSGEIIGRFLADFYESGQTNMYAYCREWLAAGGLERG